MVLRELPHGGLALGPKQSRRVNVAGLRCSFPLGGGVERVFPDKSLGRLLIVIAVIRSAKQRRPQAQKAPPRLSVAFLDLLIHSALGGLRRSGFPYRLDKPDAFVLENPLDATDRVAFAIEQMTNPPEQVDIIGPVVTPATTAFHRPDVRKPGLPKPQHMLW